mmetsp:Transcript_19387/g.45863  ORF Transcript_19387/g.45863 Transcript_19387/m.45863 type:complete len:96 (-) Transcript_19387:152-439(-)
MDGNYKAGKSNKETSHHWQPNWLAYKKSRPQNNEARARIHNNCIESKWHVLQSQVLEQNSGEPNQSSYSKPKHIAPCDLRAASLTGFPIVCCTQA